MNFEEKLKAAKEEAQKEEAQKEKTAMHALSQWPQPSKDFQKKLETRRGEALYIMALFSKRKARILRTDAKPTISGRPPQNGGVKIYPKGARATAFHDLLLEAEAEFVPTILVLAANGKTYIFDNTEVMIKYFPLLENENGISNY